jgi:hypothetical protein
MRAVTMPTELAGTPISDSAFGASTGGVNTTSDTRDWIARVRTTESQTERKTAAGTSG